MGTVTPNRKNLLDITTVVQEGLFWCWSAVGCMCALYYDPSSGWTQCKLASQSIEPSPGNCCNKKIPDACNTTWYLYNNNNQGSLITTGIANGYQTGAITYDEVIVQIDKGFPIAYRLNEKPFGSHFVILSGYDNSKGKLLVQINDSAGGITSLIPYQEFINNYQGDAVVSHTFFTKSSK